MRVLFADGNLKYASSDNMTSNNALTPDLLFESSLGVYGLEGPAANVAGNSNKWILITDGASGAGYEDAAAFTGEIIKICQGASETELGFVESSVIQLAGIERQTAQGFTAGDSQISWVGYNPDDAVGQMNFPADFTVGDSLAIRIQKDEVGAYRYTTQLFVESAIAGETEYALVKRFVEKINTNTATFDNGGPEARVVISSDDAEATDNATDTWAVTNGSKTVTMAGTADSFATGDWVEITDADGVKDVYFLTDVTTTAVTLDRVYTGETATISTGDVSEFNSVDGTTEWGIGFVFDIPGQLYYLSNGRSELNENASISTSQDGAIGSGDADYTKFLESMMLPQRGAIPTASIEFLTGDSQNLPLKTRNLSGQYDVYWFDFVNTGGDATSHDSESRTRQELFVCLETDGGNDTAAEVQSDFEDIMEDLFTLFVTVY